MVNWWRGRGLLADVVAVSQLMEPHPTGLAVSGPWGQTEGLERKRTENRVRVGKASASFPPAPSQSLGKIQGLG